MFGSKFGGKSIFKGIISIGSLFLLMAGTTACSQIQPGLGSQAGVTGKSVSALGDNGSSVGNARTSQPVASYTASKTTATSKAVTSTSSTASGNGSLIPVVVAKEVDGDTIHVTMPDGSNKTIRMLLIDTPEDVKPNTPVEPFSLQAAAFAKTELPVGKHVLIEEGKPGYTLDKYGRLLAYVYVTRNDMYNEDVVRKGLARVAYIYAPNTNHLSTLETDEAYAKSHKLGIWSLPGYVTSSGYNLAQAGSAYQTSTGAGTGSGTSESSGTLGPLGTSGSQASSGTSAAASSAGGIKVLSSQLSASDGGYASVTIRTAPNAHGTIEVDYKSGKSAASGLGSKNADGQGNITWKWQVGKKTTHGNWPVIITADGKTLHLTLHVG
jgi:micrococcal nuclease